MTGALGGVPGTGTSAVNLTAPRTLPSLASLGGLLGSREHPTGDVRRPEEDLRQPPRLPCVLPGMDANIVVLLAQFKRGEHV